MNWQNDPNDPSYTIRERRSADRSHHVIQAVFIAQVLMLLFEIWLCYTLSWWCVFGVAFIGALTALTWFEFLPNSRRARDSIMRSMDSIDRSNAAIADIHHQLRLLQEREDDE